MTNPHDAHATESLEESYARLGEENLELIAERDRLREELGKLKSAAEETEEERRARWGREILDGLDSAGGRGVRI
jgi:regulator of replication initiation timing